MMSENAWSDLLRELLPEEEVEAVVFGPWGWDGHGEPGGDDEDDPEGRQGGLGPVSRELYGKVLTPDEARPMMEGWSFHGGYGAPDCYAVHVWTTSRVLFVVQYDGSTRLHAVPRNPTPGIPEMPGG